MNAALRGGKAGGRLGLGMASLTPRACVNSLERRSGRAGPKPKPLPRRAHLVKATESEPEEGEEEQRGGGGAPEEGSKFGLPAAGAAVAIGAALFLRSSSTGGIASLQDLARESVPLEVALASGKPSVVEFYADWCEVCKAEASATSELSREHRNDLNFVMLNVDNSRWAEEVAQYGVGGIPHWEYLDSQGRSKGFVVGNVPKEVLSANADALSAGGDDANLPYVRKVAASSQIPLQAPDITVQQGDGSRPRDHG